MAERISVELCYAGAACQVLRTLEVDAGTTIEQLIGQSGLLAELPEIDLATMPVGIYGKKKPLDTVLRAQDRVEIYRPLLADPMETRRRRAAHRARASAAK